MPRRLAVALAALLLASPAAAQSLVAGYDDRPLRGSASATGAVIYSPGLVREGAPIETTPYVLDDLQAAGWDVFRFRRPEAEDTLESSVAALRNAGARLRGDGYRRVVLAGQSFGGWISLAAARADSQVDAVVALAPAAFGRRDEAPTWTENAEALYPLVESVTAGRVLVFLFAEDAYDPGGRGERLRAIFERRRLAAAVVDRPHDLTGHNAGLTAAFARRFGSCVRDFIDGAEATLLFVCPDPSGPRLSGFDAPPLSGAAPADAEPALQSMAGRWYGTYETGRDLLLSLTPSGPAAASAVYAFGAVIRGVDGGGGSTRRRGTFDMATGILRFAEPQAGTVIECRLLADDVMELAIASRTRGEPLRALLRRVE